VFYRLSTARYPVGQRKAASIRNFGRILSDKKEYVKFNGGGRFHFGLLPPQEINPKAE
jgi:hypothetical protein